MSNKIHRILNILNKEYLILTIFILTGIILRFYKINNPVADWHSWRQADTASVAREYIDNGINLFYPRYHDISTIQSGLFNPEGYRFVEFPLFNSIHAYIYNSIPFVPFDVWGRMLSILSSIVSTYLIYLIAKKFGGKNIGYLSSLLYVALPFNIYFTRVILPEPLAVTLGLAGIWLFTKYIDNKSNLSLYLSSIMFSLSALVKPFTLFYLVPVAMLLLKEGGFKKTIKEYKYYIFAVIVLLPFLIWREWISNFPEGIPLWKWVFNGSGIRFRPSFWYWVFSERIGNLILGVWGIIPLAFAFVSFKKEKTSNFIHYFLVGIFLYLSVVASANVRHDYYQTIIIPAISIAVSFGIVIMWRSKSFNAWLMKLLVLFSVLMMLISSHHRVREFYKINNPAIIEAGIAVDNLVEKDALVIAPYNGDTAFLYQTKRRGWPFRDRSLDELISKGADYYVSVSLDENTLEAMDRFKVLKQTDSFVIVDLGIESL